MKTKFNVSVLFLIGLLICISLNAKQSSVLNDQPIVLTKKTTPITSQDLQFLKNRDLENAVIWVFFNDKGIFDKNSFDQRIASMDINPKVQKRRDKASIYKPVFEDIPVKTEYINEISKLGGQLRRVSKWLNAASFEISYDNLEAIKKLSFVNHIRPVAFFNVVRPEVTDEYEADGSSGPSRADFNYGNSYSQLEQIKAVSAHQRGYSGLGITLAVFDTGYRKTHEAFSYSYINNRVLAEYDFIFNDSNTANEGVDWSSQWNHGTSTWGTAAGFSQGNVIGPAYNANIILCKTEDIRSETPVEEDNWVAAAEWVESLGTDVITSSLSYPDWYGFEDLDGQTATITIAANTASDLGVIVCNSMGNSGPGAGTLGPPADAFDILAVGAVTSTGTIASFSSRGPTYDNRIKPDVCARGVSDAVPTSTGDNTYGSSSGTSFSCPLIAGVTCLALEAHPTFPPDLIMTIMRETADNALSPDNTYGWGIVDAIAIIEWGPKFTANNTFGEAPMTVQFYDSSTVTPLTWLWDFGDGTTSNQQNPSHEFTDPGAYNVSLTIETAYGPLTSYQPGYIVALGDTLRFIPDSAYAGHKVVMSVEMTNSMDVDKIMLPFVFNDSPKLIFDSLGFGNRTEYFEYKVKISSSPSSRQYAYLLQADNGGGSPALSPGSGEIAKLYFTIDLLALGGFTNLIDTMSNFNSQLKIYTEFAEFVPVVYNGMIGTKYVLRGDMSMNYQINITDITYIINYFFESGPPPITIQAADANADEVLTITDLTYLVDYMFNGGPPPTTP